MELTIENYKEGYAVGIKVNEGLGYILQTYFRICGKVKEFESRPDAAFILEKIHSGEIGFDLSEKQYQQLTQF